MYVCHKKRSGTEPTVPKSAYSRLRQTRHSTPKMEERKGVKMVDTNNLVSATVYMSVHEDIGTGTSKSPSSNPISDMGIKFIFVGVCWQREILGGQTANLVYSRAELQKEITISQAVKRPAVVTMKRKTNKRVNVRITSHRGSFAYCLYLSCYPNGVIPFHSQKELLWRFNTPATIIRS